jgi:hypothetical protein
MTFRAGCQSCSGDPGSNDDSPWSYPGHESQGCQRPEGPHFRMTIFPMSALRRLIRFLYRTDSVTSWDRGTLDAHRMQKMRTSRIRERLELALRQRRRLGTRLLPGRLSYLNGLIHGLKRELKWRGDDAKP